MRSCGDFGNVAQQGDVLRTATELVVGDSRGNRLAARRVILLGIGMHVEAALSYFRCIVEILDQMILADIQQFDAHVLAEIGLVDQRFDPAPG
ncbi:hypothetical protein D3C76_1100640 [compost metagenome]